MKHILSFGLLGLLPLAFAQGRAQRFFIPYGWLWALSGILAVAGGIALVAYLYARATRPGKAGQYVGTAVTHIFIWVAVILTFFPIITLLAVSFNENNNLNRALPTEGNLLVRTGLLPPAEGFSFVQYEKFFSAVHLYPYQWGLIALALLALVALLALRGGGARYRLERLRTLMVWLIVGCAAALILTLNPGQFYGVNAQGQPTSSDYLVILYIRNTLLVSGLTGLFAVLISTTAGYAFARMRFEGRYGSLLAFVFVQMFPGFMALVAIFYLMNYLGLLNTFTGLILAYSGGAISFSAWIFKGYLESVSPSLEEAAMVDGTTRWGAFWRIILPLSVPMLLFIFLLQFIGTYSEFILANILLTGQEQWTVGVGLRSFVQNQFTTKWGELAAAAVLGSVPILVIFYSFQNALTGQYTAGGVKG